ncbi:MAG: M3 family metallopeptidase [Flavobacteriaceae bacterium]|nr:M3 family metallopeptidase [Flavobacteriaceae bacterium]MCY4267524.1 M3 family metallopeptidase [Flavobacteriaceae bacterium]
MDNPFFQEFSTQRKSIPFSELQAHHFLPAIEFYIQNAEETIKTITNSKKPPTFENTILPFENLEPRLNDVVLTLMNLNHAHTTKELQQVVMEASPLLTHFKNNLLFNAKLYQRVHHVFKNNEASTLNSVQQRLIEKQYKAFIRNGIHLSTKKQKQLREIDSQLAQLSIQFGKNVLADTQAFQLHITDHALLDGLPKQILEIAALNAKNQKKEGWILTLDQPIYIAVQKFCHRRDIRKQLAIGFRQIGFQKNENNNISIVIQLIKLRKQKASLLGYASFAEYVLEERMAHSLEKVSNFLDELYNKTHKHGLNEWQQLCNYANEKFGIENIQKWDVAYLSEALKKQWFGIDDNVLKAFFPLEKVISGLFEITHKLYDLKFYQSKSYQTYHSEVEVYEVVDSQEHFKALLYLDLYPREGKRAGAWMTNYKEQSQLQRPHVSLVCNFPKPTSSSPSLLSFMDVRTLFHEFGHALHSMLSEVSYRSLGGTNVLWDFVELPSQIMENWCYQAPTLKLFARHYQTNEVIPMEYVEKIKKANNFQSGLQTLRQLGLGMLDLSFHHQNADNIVDIKQHETTVLKATEFTPDVSSTCLSTSFAHIFQGGYAAGYYGYKWAEVLDADAFECFLDQGIFNKSLAQKFKSSILSQGDSEHPMALFKKFRGREPKLSALIRRMGFENH